MPLIKKDFNQNFLINKKAIELLIKISKLNKKDHIIEIGTGKGEITLELAKIAEKVISLEIDENLSKFHENMPKNVKVIYSDAKDYLIKNKKETEFNKIISSPPYNLLEPLIHILIRVKSIEMTCLITPEGFCDKLIINPIFSSFFIIKKHEKIDKSSFEPIPKIDSEIITLERKSNPTRKDLIIQSLYFQEDKKLKNAILTTSINLGKSEKKVITKNEAKDIISHLNIPEKDLNTKVENIKFQTYKTLSELL